VFGEKPAAVVEQRRDAGAMRAVLHLADKYHMVAFGVTAAVEAFKGGHGAGQQGRTAGPFDKLHIGKSVCSARGETQCQRLLTESDTGKARAA